MNFERFAYWLQGYVEVTGGEYPTPEQWEIVKDHLSLVFNKVTPVRDVQGRLPDQTREVVQPPAKALDKAAPKVAVQKDPSPAKAIPTMVPVPRAGDLADILRKLQEQQQGGQQWPEWPSYQPYQPRYLTDNGLQDGRLMITC